MVTMIRSPFVWLCNLVLTTILVHNPPIFMWLDNKIVLHWLKSQKPLLTLMYTSPHHRDEFDSLLLNTTWKYCPTADNPADLLSRCMATKNLMSLSLWQHGHKWLTTPHQWPSSLNITCLGSSSSNRVYSH